MHRTCFGALLMHRSNKDVFIAICDAFYWINADNRKCTRTCRNCLWQISLFTFYLWSTTHFVIFSHLLIPQTQNGRELFRVTKEGFIFFKFCFEAEIQQGLADRNLHVVILLGLQQHASCPEAQAAGCRALRGMCIFCPGAKVRVKQESTSEIREVQTVISSFSTIYLLF